MFRKPKSPNKRNICMTAPVWQSKGICGTVPDVDAGSILSEPWTLRETRMDIIPEDNYAERPFYFGGSNVWMYDQIANDRVVTYNVDGKDLTGGRIRAKKCRKTLVKGCR